MNIIKYFELWIVIQWEKLDRIQSLTVTQLSLDPSWPAGYSVLTGGLSDCCSHDNISWTQHMMPELSWSCPSSSGHPLMGEGKKMSVTRCRSINLLAVILLLFSSAGKTKRSVFEYMSLLHMVSQDVLYSRIIETVHKNKKVYKANETLLKLICIWTITQHIYFVECKKLNFPQYNWHL